MGGKRRSNSGGLPPKQQQSHRARLSVVVTDDMLSKIPANKGASSSSAIKATPSTKKDVKSTGAITMLQPASADRMWGVLASKGQKVEEIVYRILLVLLEAISDKHVVLCVANREICHEAYLILKLLVKIIYVSDKMTKKQISNNLSGLSQGASVVMTDTDSNASVASKNIQSNQVGFVIHAFNPQEAISASLCRRYTAAEHMLIATQVSHLLHCPTRFPMPKQLNELAKADARVSLARKIVAASNSGSVQSATVASVSSSQLLQMRNRLKAMMSERLLLPLWDVVNKCLKEINSPKTAQNTMSMQEKMSKMSLLGMVSRDLGAVHEKVESGRVLASSQWMDAASGEMFGAPWGVVRHGASFDDVSKKVNCVVNTMKDYSVARLGKLSNAGRETTISGECECVHKKLLSKRVLDTLSKCKIIAFSWKPNPLGDDEKWGGKYGKSCGHNEVVMFYLRPFAPIEVLNTHLCSKASPAPGNISFDGCLEFIMQQCKWFERSMHIWDDASFHFINSKGGHFVTPKIELMSYPVPRLKFLLAQLRWFCIHMPEIGNVKKMIEVTDAYLAVATGSIKLRADISLSTKVSHLIGSFLLCENRNVWNNATSL